MTPKETSEYLINKFSIIPINMGFPYKDTIELRKDCALITAQEVLSEIEQDTFMFLFWQNVIKEIKLI